MPGLSKQFATLVYIAVPIAKPKFQAFFKSSNENEKSEIQLSFVFKWLPGFSESFWLHCASFSQGLALFFLPDASVWLQLLPHYYLHTILQAILGYCLVLQATNDDAFTNKNKHKAFKLSNQTHHLVNQVPFSTFWMDPCYLKESFWGGFHKLVF